MKIKLILLIFTPFILCGCERAENKYAKEFAHSLFYDFYPSALKILQEWERNEDIEETLPYLAYLLYEAQKPSGLSYSQVFKAICFSPEGSKARKNMEKVYFFFNEELLSERYDGQ